MYYTMKEVQEITKLSRSTIYRYLRNGVVTPPVAKNRKGVLLFSENQLAELQERVGIDDKTPVEYVDFTTLVEEKMEEPKETPKSSSPFKKGTGKIKTPFKSNKPTREDFYGK